MSGLIYTYSMSTLYGSGDQDVIWNANESGMNEITFGEKYRRF